MLKGWGLWDRDRIGTGRSRITCQLRIALTVLPGASCSVGGLAGAPGPLWSRAGGNLVTRSSSNSGLFSTIHLCSSLPHIFLVAKRSGRMKTGIN